MAPSFDAEAVAVTAFIARASAHLDVLDLKALDEEVVHPDQRQRVLDLETCKSSTRFVA